MKRNGLLFVVSSPSGAGKTTLSRLLLEKDTQLVLSVSVTTRKARSREVEGQDYFFISEEEFEQRVQQNHFAEHTAIFGNRYGTPIAQVERRISEGTDVLFDVDWKGAAHLKKAFPQDVVSVFIFPPSMGELRRRLEERAQDDLHVLERRLEGAQEAMGHWGSYDYVIVNHVIEDSLAQMHAILTAERARRDRQCDLEAFVQQLADA